MAMTNKQRTLLGVGVVVLIALVTFVGHYRTVGILFLPLGLWLNLTREPEQMQMRPWIRVLGWVFVGFAVGALIASIVAITTGR